jgi:hypothetical protein
MRSGRLFCTLCVCLQQEAKGRLARVTPSTSLMQCSMRSACCAMGVFRHMSVRAFPSCSGVSHPDAVPPLYHTVLASRTTLPHSVGSGLRSWQAAISATGCTTWLLQRRASSRLRARRARRARCTSLPATRRWAGVGVAQQGVTAGSERHGLCGLARSESDTPVCCGGAGSRSDNGHCLHKYWVLEPVASSSRVQTGLLDLEPR